MKRALLFISWILLALQLPGQINKYGIPVIKNFSAEEINGSDYTHSIIKDNLGNIYLANEDIGIIRYDGSNWRSIPVRNNQLIRTFAKDKMGTIYLGGTYEFGYLEPDNFGRMAYVSLSQRFDDVVVEPGSSSDSALMAGVKQKINIGEILSLVVNDSHVYFVSSKSLFDYDIINDTLKYINLQDFNVINALKIFLIGQKVILGDNNTGLLEYKDGIIEKLPGGDFFTLKRCMVVIPYDEEQAIVATFGSGLYLYNYVTGEVSIDFIKSSLHKLLIDSRVYSGTALPDGEFALGTIHGGVFIFDFEGQLIESWDKDNSDLTDNSVLAFYCDYSVDSELWISTVGNISRAYINLPFTEFSQNSGIDGGVNCFCEMNGNLYVSTDLGVYKSITNETGLLKFIKIPEIIDQVFPIVLAKTGGDEFLLAGSANGIYKISKRGVVSRITFYTRDEAKRKYFPDMGMFARSIVQSKINTKRFYIGTNSHGVKMVEYNAGKWEGMLSYEFEQGIISGMAEVENGDLLFSTDFSNSVFRVAYNDSIPVKYGTDKGIPEATINAITTINNEIVLATGNGLYKYLKDSDSWISFDEVTGNYSAGKESTLGMQDQDNDLWIDLKESRYSVMLFKRSEEKINSYFGPLALLPNAKMQHISNFDNKIWIAKSNRIFVVEKERLMTEAPIVSPLLTKIVVGRDSLIMDESFFVKGEWGKNIPVRSRISHKVPELRNNLNSVSFFWATPFFINEEETVYSYKLDGFDNDWSEWEKVVYKDYTSLPFGHYYFRVKAMTATEILTNETVYQFIILKPWYLKTVMIVIYTIALLFTILLIIKAYTRKLKNENLRLEGIVAERTAVVVKQKDELESSIHYASRIQLALLPSEAILSENIKNYFVLFKPRDIVSGDFYWMTKKGERLYIAAADCTGHGVPGAFMSLLGMSFLDEIIDKSLAPRADVILKELRLHVTESLKQVGGEDEAKDGMDVALFIIDFSQQKIEFSGAYNPCFRVRMLTAAESENYQSDSMNLPDGSMSNGKYLLETIYASKMPIGISSKMDEEFILNTWGLKKGISYYLFSDGYVDQFGGPKGRKFMKKNFKRLILDIQDYPMSKQKTILDTSLKDWMGSTSQIDDVLVMGIRTD